MFKKFLFFMVLVSLVCANALSWHRTLALQERCSTIEEQHLELQAQMDSEREEIKELFDSQDEINDGTITALKAMLGTMETLSLQYSIWNN